MPSAKMRIVMRNYPLRSGRSFIADLIEPTSHLQGLFYRRIKVGSASGSKEEAKMVLAKGHLGQTTGGFSIQRCWQTCHLVPVTHMCDKAQLDAHAH